MSDDAVLHRRSSGIARFFRGWIIAVLAVVLAAGGHQIAHSMMHGATETIPLQLLAFAAALTAPIAVALAGQRISTWSTAATTIFGQIAFHTLYSLPYTGVSQLPNGHDHHGHMAHLVTPDTPAVQHAAHTTALAGFVMIAAHLLAAALTVVVITNGEHTLITLAHWLTMAPVRIVLATRPVILARRSSVAAGVRVWVPHPMNVTQTRTTRGPPVLA